MNRGIGLRLRLRRAITTGLAAGAAALLIPAAASAATITVNTTADTTANDGSCTLREAIVAANTDTASGAAAGECVAGVVTDTINFSAAFTGNVATSTISVATDLPSVTQPVTIDGANCGTSSDPRPCVGLDANGNFGFIVQAANTTFSGLAITDALDGSNALVDRAIDGTPQSANLAVRGSWFGIRLDGTPEPNEEGVRAEADQVDVGGITAAQRNVFAANDFFGLEIRGGDNGTIRGNYFGTMPDGQTTTGVGNGRAIKVVGTTPPAAVPTGTVIGGADAGTPTTCDGACNVISNSSAVGILLSAGGIGNELDAGQTQISGNFIGLDRTGTLELSNVVDGIRIGDADNITIGGATAADRNYIGGGPSTSAISAGSGAAGLVIRNDFVGLSADGASRLGSGGAITLGAPALTAPVIRDNRIADVVGTPISATANGADIRGNVVGIGTGGQNVGGGANAGIFVAGDNATIGGTSPGDPNVVGNSGGGGILVSGSNNAIVANFVGTNQAETQQHPNVGAGISVANGDVNTVGGVTAASGNVVSNSGDDAIVVMFDGSDRNLVGSNRGRNNGDSASDLFIDLDPPNGAGNNAATGPNNGIQAATLSTVNQTTATGTGAAVNATLQAFVVNKPQGTVKRLAGQFTDTDGGSWSITFSSALADGECVQVTQTDDIGDTSELSNEVCDTDTTPPETTIDSGPSGPTNDSTPTFGFSANEDATFECRIYPGVTPSGSFSACGDTLPDTQGSFTSSSLTDGQYTFEVKATDRGSNPDATPAQRTFTVDALPPETTIDSGPADGSIINSSTASFTFSSSEAGSSFECRIDGGAFGPCSGPGNSHTAGPLADGQHTFEVRATDVANNTDASPASRTFTVSTAPPEPPAAGDTTPPDTTITDGPKSKTKKKTATFSFTSTEAGSTFECKLDDGNFEPCTSPKDVKVKKGKHTFEVRAKDAAGNVDPTPASQSWKVKKKK